MRIGDIAAGRAGDKGDVLDLTLVARDDAAYALLDTQAMQLVFHRVPYDHATAAAKVRAAGLPESLALALENGN